MKILAIAQLTLLELWRQRTQWGFLVVAVLMALPAFLPLEGIHLNGAAPVASAITGGLLGFAQFVALFLAIASTSGLVAGDQERGTSLMLLSKPMHRHTLLFGKLLGGAGYLTLAWIGWGAVAALAIGFKFGLSQSGSVFLAFAASSIASWLIVAFTLFWSCWMPANAATGLGVLGYLLAAAAPKMADASTALGHPRLGQVLEGVGRALPMQPLWDAAKAILEGTALTLQTLAPAGMILVWWAAAALVYARRDLGSGQ